MLTIVLFGPGTWFIVTQRPHLTIGGDENKSAADDRHALNVDGAGESAIRIGLAFYGVGLIGLSEGIHSRRRIPVFGVGAVLLLGCLVWWVASAFVGS